MDTQEVAQIRARMETDLIQVQADLHKLLAHIDALADARGCLTHEQQNLRPFVKYGKLFYIQQGMENLYDDTCNHYRNQSQRRTVRSSGRFYCPLLSRHGQG